jgi:hypothetical protein
MRAAIITLTSLAALGVAGCAYNSAYDRAGHGPYGPYAYDGAAYAGPRAPYAGELHGPGLDILDPWLRGTREGQAVVTLGFREAAGGFVSEDVAHRANIWFRRYADENRDMRITDPEIRTALVQATGRYLR